MYDYDTQRYTGQSIFTEYIKNRSLSFKFDIISVFRQKTTNVESGNNL